MTPQRAAAVDTLHAAQATSRERAALAAASGRVLRGLVGAGAIEPIVVDIDRPYPKADPAFAEPQLNADQQDAADTFVNAVRKGGFHPFLLDGVTGSGKTECY